MGEIEERQNVGTGGGAPIWSGSCPPPFFQNPGYAPAWNLPENYEQEDFGRDHMFL